MRRIFKQSLALILSALVLMPCVLEAQNKIDEKGRKQGKWSKA